MDYELLLINVSRDYSGLSESFRDSIGQYLIAAYLRSMDFKAFVYSGDIKGCKTVIEKELNNHRTGMIGFYVAADNIRVTEHVIYWVKQKYPWCRTIVGGPQAVGLDYDFFERTGNDFAIMGEGEIPVYYLLLSVVDHDFGLEKVPSLIRRDDEKTSLVINGCKDAVINNLDMLDFPRNADSITGRLRQGEVVGIITGRGCPFNCSFCYEGANAKNVRLRSISKVMEEIDYIRENNPKLKFIYVYDDTFTLKKERVLEFCTEMKKRELMWFCEGHITFVLKHPDVLEKMVESGLVCIQFGIESGSDKVLDAYHKHTSFDMILEAVDICKKAGVHSITGNFIIGGAHETRETIEMSKHLAGELIRRAKGIIELRTVYFAPYPNTKMVREPEQFGIEILKDAQEISINTMRTPVVRTKELSRENIYDLKHEFDEFLKAEYRVAAHNARKADIQQGLFHNGIRISVNPTWEHIYSETPHISAFLNHMMEEEQNFHADYYIIRTFEDIKIKGGRLISDVGVFENLEKDILTYATGLYTASQMAEMFHTSIAVIEKCYYSLNERCLVYITEF
ncbi:MAG: radical SAM protein [Eubacteriales bacterium]|nr:radical SAM protein [Eubacteriales bacterium]